MMPTHQEISGGRSGDRTGLLGSAMNTFRQAAWRCNMAWKRPVPVAIERKTCLPISRSAIESSERLAAVAGQSLSGKSRLYEQRDHARL